jgi:hypothetical protein
MGLAETLLRHLERQPERVFTLTELCRATGPHDCQRELARRAPATRWPVSMVCVVERTLATLLRMGVVASAARHCYALVAEPLQASARRAS